MHVRRFLLAPAAVAATALVASGGVLAPAGGADTAVEASPGVVQCEDGAAQARVKEGSNAAEPALYGPNDAKKYGVIKDHPRMANGSVTIDVVFHVISETPLSDAETARKEQMISDQMDVLNAAYSGDTAAQASDTPFRFRLSETNWVVNAGWAHVAPGKTERDMKHALHEGDSETLNVYAADIGGGLLGWAYFPKDYNHGRAYIDGVVMLDESMPGGTAGKYSFGDTLTHEVGHWLMLEHTFAGACSASGDGVADTPREAVPQFDCPEGADTCTAPGLDPIHNFMDYTRDECMNMFTPGQANRMSDAWIEFRQGGNG